ncbi:hypothetical protein [uncultured Arcobacter sp.]|uniref:hypothetical protein n=1 Tax=uncultured Arcobacter sp. TaxID=165434 RepID=UPI00262CA6F0|nr:hypothetical protein [uncultured Arcobacter sp.]
MNCKKCGKKFHYCSSCDSIDHMDKGYCSSECYGSSDEYTNIDTITNELLESMSDETFKKFKYFMDEIYWKYETICDTAIDMFEKRKPSKKRVLIV